MTSRQRVLTAMRRRQPDRVPKYMSFTPFQVDALRDRAGTTDAERYWRLDVREVSPGPVAQIPDISAYLSDRPPGSWVDEWGVVWTKSGFHHFVGMTHPMKDISSVGDIQRYPFPDLAADCRFEGYAEAIAEAHECGLAVRADCTPLGGTILWPAYKLRGMEALLMDIALQPELAAALLDRVTQIVRDYAVKLAGYDIDILWIADDFGTQRALLCSLEMWREWFKGRIREVVRAAKAVRPDILVALHSDGAVQELVPDLIEIGIDILNPVQPECVDPVVMKREFGRDISFWGTIGTQTTLPFGTPEEVRSEVRRMIDMVGVDGGLLIAPTHVVEPEVPWENIVALVEAVEEFGVYA